MIKIPATPESIPAAAEAIAHGISVNVTLIFSPAAYTAVLDSWLTGLERAAERGHDLRSTHSVASVFVSRVDGVVDQLLDAIGSTEALALRGRAALANARLVGDTVTGTQDQAAAVVTGLASLGIDLGTVLDDLQAAGVRSFTETWQRLLDTTETRRQHLSAR